MQKGAARLAPELSIDWRRQRRLAFLTVLGVLFVALGLPAFVQTLNLVKVAGFPLGFYLAAQGSPLLVGIMVFYYARRANRLSRSPSRRPGPGQ